MKRIVQSRWFHPLLLLLWIGIGAALRFTNLAAKPPWTDEFATMVFSLGNSFQTVPLDQAIALDTLLQPLQVNPTTISDVTRHLFTEDVHPPLYFVLSHLWLRLFSPEGQLISLWAARSLPAVLGVLSIPAMYGLGWLTLRCANRAPGESHLVGQLAAALMAVSPFGVYLAQEARHYTLGILWVIASLACLIAAVQAIYQRRGLSPWIVLAWIITNSLGVATHFFILLTLAAEAIALFAIGIWRNGKTGQSWIQPPWPRIYLAILGTLAGCAVWVPLWLTIRSREITQWIQNDGSFDLLALISPIFQAIATWITMIALLPVEASQLPIVIGSGVIMLVFFVWAVPIWRRGLQAQWQRPDRRPIVGIVGGFVLGAIALFFFVTYALGADLTRGARYSFVYFAGVILLLAMSLAVCWQQTQPWPTSSTLESTSPKPQHPFARLTQRYGRQAVLLIWLMGLASGLTVVNNLGYRKYYRPELLTPLIQQTAERPVLVATTQSTLVQIGELMGLGWQLQDIEARSLQFLLAAETSLPCEENCQATPTLTNIIDAQPNPLELWLVNFEAPVELDPERCVLDPAPQKLIYGYQYQLYHCDRTS